MAKYTIDKRIWNFFNKHAPDYNLKEILDDYQSFGKFEDLIKFLTVVLPEPITMSEIVAAIIEGEDTSKIKIDDIEIPTASMVMNIPKNLRKYSTSWWLQDVGEVFHRDDLLKDKELNKSGSLIRHNNYRMCVDPDGSINKYGVYFKDKLAVRPIIELETSADSLYNKIKPYIDLGLDYTINLFDREWKFIDKDLLIYSGEPILKPYDRYIDDFDASDIKTETDKWLKDIKSKVTIDAPKFDPYLIEIDLLTKDEFDALPNSLKKYSATYWLKTPVSTREVYTSDGKLDSDDYSYIRPVLVVSGVNDVDKIKLVDNAGNEAIFNKISRGRYLLNNDNDSIKFSKVTTTNAKFGKISKFNGSDVEDYLKNDLLDDYKQAKIEIA